MPAGRPPRAPEDGDEEYYEEGEEHHNQYEEGDEEFPQAEEGEERPTGEEDEEHDGDDASSSSSSEESVDVVEYIPPPEEKPFPPPTTQGGVPFHYIIDLGAIASEATSGNDTRKLVLPSPQENDPRYPKWLHYILNDDYPSLSYLIHPPPGAEIDLTTHDKNNADNQGGDNNNNKNNNNGEEYDEEGGAEDEDEEGVSTGRDSRGEVGENDDDEDVEYDSEGNPISRGASRTGNQEVEFHPNEKFLLMPSDENPNDVWNLLPYELPKPPRYLKGKNHENGEDEDGGGSRNGDSVNGGGFSGRDSANSYGNGSQDADEDDDQNQQNDGTSGRSGASPEEKGVVVDVLVLAALFSPQALAMCIKERKKPLKNDPEDQKKPQYDEDGHLIPDEENEEEEIPEEEMDDETLRKRRRSPPTLRCFWKFCERYSGTSSSSSSSNALYNNECKPLSRLIEAQTCYQDEEIVEVKKPKKKAKKPKKVIDEETGEEYFEEPEEEEDENKFDPDAETATEKKMTRAQKRRLFLDYNRAFDLIASAPSVAAAQRIESIIKMMIVDANISPDTPIDLTTPARALHNINTLQAYITVMEHIPRSVVTQNAQAWLEPTLTEEEINAYPEGAENIPDEHPPKIPPTLWKIFQQVRRRTAKESKGKDAPKRSLLQVLKKFFTPQVESNISGGGEPASIDAKKKETPAVIHSDKYPPTYDEEFDDLAKTIDPCYTSDFDAQRDYLPNKLAIYMSDVVLLLLSRHDFAAESFKWLGELKRDFPHSKWDNVSSSHLLAFSVNRMATCNATTTVSSLMLPEWFSERGRIFIHDFIREVISKENTSDHCLDTGSFINTSSVLEIFARRFARVFLGKDNMKYFLQQVKQAPNEELFQLIMRAEINRQEFEKFVLDTAGWNTPTKDSDLKLQDKLKCFTEVLGFEAVICTSQTLKTAVDARNVKAVRFLIREGGVTRVAHSRGDIPVLEYCVETKNETVLIALIEDYGNIHQTLRGGQRDVFAAIQENFIPPPNAKKIFFFDGENGNNNNNNEKRNSSSSSSSSMYLDIMESVKRVEAAVREAEARRGADPTSLLGIRVGSKV